jgi:hypothetical protein
MRNRQLARFVTPFGIIFLSAFSSVALSKAFPSQEGRSVDPKDPTYQLFQLLDTTRGGQLKDFYVLADIYKDPNDPSLEYRHVLRVEYDGKRLFGKFRIYVRSVSRMTPEQLEAYTPAQIYNFAAVDEEKFEKMEPGPFGQPGDVYFRAEPGEPLHSAPTTDAIRKAYETFITQFILPALKASTMPK